MQQALVLSLLPWVLLLPLPLVLMLLTVVEVLLLKGLL
jgi:hypothetical protein